jgi:hypothetical protein
MIISGTVVTNAKIVDVQPIYTTNLVANYDAHTSVSGTTFSDTSGNGYNATIYNSASTTTYNGYNVLQLNSTSSQYFTYTSGYTTMGTAVTFDAWFYSKSAGTAQVVISEFGQSGYSGGWNDDIMGMNTTNILGGVYCAGNGGQVPSISSWNANQWYHVVFTYSANTLTLYINGVNQGSVTSTRSTTPTTLYYAFGYPDSSAGYYLSGANGYFNGYIGAIKLYSAALTQTQVTRNFNALRYRYGI